MERTFSYQFYIILFLQSDIGRFRCFESRSGQVKVQLEKSRSARTDLTTPVKLFVGLWNVVRGRFSRDNELFCICGNVDQVISHNLFDRLLIFDSITRLDFFAINKFYDTRNDEFVPEFNQIFKLETVSFPKKFIIWLYSDRRKEWKYLLTSKNFKEISFKSLKQIILTWNYLPLFAYVNYLYVKLI